MANVSRPQITPFLWFHQGAEKALAFYTSIFKDARILSKRNLGPAPADGSEPMMTATLRIGNLTLHVLNAPGGPAFSAAISLMIECETQEEVDYYWDTLSKDGTPQPCGWLIDSFGISWQVVPQILNHWLADPEKAPRVMPALMQMTKIDIATLENSWKT